MKVEIIEDQNLWDTYVKNAGASRLYHLWAWRDVIEQSFGHRSLYLAAIDGTSIKGVLPLTSIKSWLFGSSLVSLPFCTYGGVLADSAEARDELLAEAIKYARELNANHVELRQGEDCDLRWIDTIPKVAMEIELPGTVDTYLKALTPSRRKRIRYNLKRGFRTEWAGAEAIRIFYSIFAENMRDLGTPVYPCRFFENQFLRFPEHRVVILWDGLKAVAAGVIAPHGRTLELPWAASLSEYHNREATGTMYWSIIENAIVQGYTKLDLGRCTVGSGNWTFKRHWNPIERPLHWYYWLQPGAAVPALRPENPRFRIATNIWRRMPLMMANGLGPRVVRSIP